MPKADHRPEEGDLLQDEGDYNSNYALRGRPGSSQTRPKVTAPASKHSSRSVGCVDDKNSRATAIVLPLLYHPSNMSSHLPTPTRPLFLSPASSAARSHRLPSEQRTNGLLYRHKPQRTHPVPLSTQAPPSRPSASYNAPASTPSKTSRYSPAFFAAANRA
ncbi:unnamed protein product [Zymoseptoria tritici ST99CH_1E4]|uniref:Uncharacterized protein n=1 Tax=Zymoseptoria tritici ST99CH_1E4 TaxID=1276532 RepID=A0A2H1HA16_ZYMTR|nr:unnamed protein product [Zymoseptoria tritici ST99CH_1E4]